MSYVIDISKETCWNDLVTEYKSRIITVIDKIRPLYSQYLTGAYLILNGYRLFGGTILYEKEIEHISKILGISFTECLLFQLCYEMNSACTSALVEVDGVKPCKNYGLELTRPKINHGANKSY